MAENLQAAGGNDEGEEGENHDDGDDEQLMTYTTVILLPNLMVTMMVEIHCVRLVRAQIVIRLMEVIQMEVMIRSLLMSKSRVVQPTKLWYHLSQR